MGEIIEKTLWVESPTYLCELGRDTARKRCESTDDNDCDEGNDQDVFHEALALVLVHEPDAQLAEIVLNCKQHVVVSVSWLTWTTAPVNPVFTVCEPGR